MSTPLETAGFSREVFGRHYRIPVWAKVLEYSIEPPEHFCMTDVSSHLVGKDINLTSIHQEIRALADLGMIEARPDHGQYPSRYYVRVESAGWEMVDAAIRFAEQSDTRQ